MQAMEIVTLLPCPSHRDTHGLPGQIRYCSPREQHTLSTIPLASTMLKLSQINTGVREQCARNMSLILWTFCSDIYSCIMSSIAKTSFPPHLQFRENQLGSYMRERERKTRSSGSRDTHAGASGSNSVV